MGHEDNKHPITVTNDAFFKKIINYVQHSTLVNHFDPHFSYDLVTRLNICGMDNQMDSDHLIIALCVSSDIHCFIIVEVSKLHVEIIILAGNIKILE